jgi:hypothetical protein
MKNMFNPEQVTEIQDRLKKLTKNSQHQWGKMGVSQMLEHCSIGVHMALREFSVRRMFVSYILGGIIKYISLKDDKPMRENSPTVPGMAVTGAYNYEEEREKLSALISRFFVEGRHIEPHLHPFFGEMNPQEWAILMYKHLDHHLRQFGA